MSSASAVQYRRPLKKMRRHELASLSPERLHDRGRGTGLASCPPSPQGTHLECHRGQPPRRARTRATARADTSLGHRAVPCPSSATFDAQSQDRRSPEAMPPCILEARDTSSVDGARGTAIRTVGEARMLTGGLRASQRLQPLRQQPALDSRAARLLFRRQVRHVRDPAQVVTSHVRIR
jgi:hypothetical protein